MSDQGTTCNPHWHKRHRQDTIMYIHGVTHDLIKHTRNCNGLTMGNVALKHTANLETDTTDYTVHRPIGSKVSAAEQD